MFFYNPLQKFLFPLIKRKKQKKSETHFCISGYFSSKNYETRKDNVPTGDSFIENTLKINMGLTQPYSVQDIVETSGNPPLQYLATLVHPDI